MIVNHKPNATLGDMILAEYESLPNAGLIIRYGENVCRVFREDYIEFGKDYIAVEIYSSDGEAPYPKTVIPLHMVTDIHVVGYDKTMRSADIQSQSPAVK